LRKIGHKNTPLKNKTGQHNQNQQRKWVSKWRELPGFAIVNEKKRPHPWDTHHQFSIKTLLSKGHKNNNLSNIWPENLKMMKKNGFQW